VSADRQALKTALDRLYSEYNHAAAASDPIEIARRYPDPRDREVVAFLAAALAFGRVASVLKSIEALLATMPASPAAFVRRFTPARDAAAMAALGHRWIRSADLAALLWILRAMLERAGSIEAFFLEGHDPTASDVGPSLESFSTRALAFDLRAAYGVVPGRAGVCSFFPRPSSGSACKRLNLFLRWMVRRDAVDFGLWPHVSPSALIVPLDTHVIRVGRCLRLTRYASPGWRMAADITASLRALDPHDPVKYDFALCHLGMMNACGFSRAAGDRHCPLRGLCRPRPRRRAPSRRPSARR
jgi:uncharacterized protein (TIGR02757 family)